VEINLNDLESMAKKVRTVRKNIKEYDLGDRKVYVLAEGRLVNLAAGDGHPAEVMDMSFANQALCVRHKAENKLVNGVHVVPKDIDIYVAELKLKSMGVSIDSLSKAQCEYMCDWKSGT
jgi:adenosylhomocysteinase